MKEQLLCYSALFMHFDIVMPVEAVIFGEKKCCHRLFPPTRNQPEHNNCFQLSGPPIEIEKEIHCRAHRHFDLIPPWGKHWGKLTQFESTRKKMKGYAPYIFPDRMQCMLALGTLGVLKHLKV